MIYHHMTLLIIQNIVFKTSVQQHGIYFAAPSSTVQRSLWRNVYMEEFKKHAKFRNQYTWWIQLKGSVLHLFYLHNEAQSKEQCSH